MNPNLRSWCVMRLPYLLISALFVTIAAACGGSATDIDPKISLPEDERPHDAGIEWWYFNGLLSDDRGNDYSFHFVTFQGQAENGVAPHLMQASFGDHTEGTHLTGEQVYLAPLDLDAESIDIEVDGWEMQWVGDHVYSLEFRLDEYFLDLKLTATRPPVLHQGTGLVGLGPAGDTYYYSRTRLDIAGNMSGNGPERPITGTSWMDHQWGDVVGQQVGWDWVSVQLDDGSDLMAVLVWDPADKEPFAGYGTLVTADGAALTLAQNDIAIDSLGTWSSPKSGIEYPSGWNVSVASQEISLELRPVLVNAEFADSQYTPAAYWEGAVSVTGHRGEQSVGGQGFVELVGYDPRQLESAP
ncbi:MAG: hypothetical protein FI717_01025 [SAR202 cluster bacterium]|nr:hypothetical protein [SAR202 cluster bacterium]